MGTSPDVGGSRGLGRPQTLDYAEQAQTAQTAVLKAGVGLVQTTIDIPLHQVGGERYKYLANQSKPNLKTKVLVAMTRPEPPRANPKEEEEFQRLVDELPLQLSLELQEERKKPAQEKNPKFVVFELILRFVAKALVWLESVSQIDSSQHSLNNAKIQAFSHATLRGWIEVARQVSLDLQSSPAPLLHTLQGERDAKTNAQILIKFINYSKAVLKSNQKRQKRILKKFEKELLLLKQQIETKKIRGVFSITKSLINNLTDHIGTFIDENSSAILVTIMRTENNQQFTKGIDPVLKLLAVHPDLSPMQTLFLPSLMKFSALFFPLLSITASGKRKLDSKNDPRLKHEYVQSLAMRLAVGLISHAEVIPMIAEKLFKSIHIEGDVNSLMTAATDAMAMNALSISAAEKAGPLMNGVKKKLIEKLEILRKEAKEKEMIASIRQADIALKRKENISGYFEAIRRMLHLKKLKITDLQDECTEITLSASVLLNAFHDTREQRNFTSAVIEAA